MATPDFTWRTARLIAQPATSEHAQALFDSYASDPAVARFMTWTPHRSLSETEQFLRRCERAWLEGSAFPWTLWLDPGDELAGILEIRVRGNSIDLGYALARCWWRQGLMSEAVTAIVHWALAQPDIYRVWAVCDIENVASARLLERVGMQCEGILRRWLVHPNLSDAPRDCFCYSIVKPVRQDI
jgi:RimJ/RimL family protein N-acetyltransferase